MHEGVAGLIRQTQGAIGYVELAYAKQNKLPVAHIMNRHGKFIEPTIASTTAAAEGAAAMLARTEQHFDALVTDRPYRKGQSRETALDILEAGAGRQWDSELVALFPDALASSAEAV